MLKITNADEEAGIYTKIMMLKVRYFTDQAVKNKNIIL